MKLEKGPVPLLKSLLFPEQFGHAITTRVGGVSTGPCESLNIANRPSEKREDLLENRRRACRAAGIESTRLTALNQELGAKVIRVSREMIGNAAGSATAVPYGDALITNIPGVPLLTYSADCCLALIADPVHNAVASVHASRAGAFAEILKATVVAMRKEFDSSPGDLIAAIGPTLKTCCHELKPPDLDSWREKFPRYLDGNRLNLEAAVAGQLEAAGVRHIDKSGRCTKCEKELFFSHRRDGESTGRFGALIWVR